MNYNVPIGANSSNISGYGYNSGINTSGLQPPNTFSSGINNVPVTVNTSNIGGYGYNPAVNTSTLQPTANISSGLNAPIINRDHTIPTAYEKAAQGSHGYV